MPPSRPLQPFLGITTPSLSTRPRPIPAFRIQRYQSNDPKGRQESFPYYATFDPGLKREDLLIKLRFPRNYMSTVDKIRWTKIFIPQLTITLYRHYKNYLLGGMKIPPEIKDVKVESRIGRFIYDFVSQPAVMNSLNLTILPWGTLSKSRGSSMKPTLPGDPSITYRSHAYTDEKDVKLGDVVVVVPFKYDDDGDLYAKRIAALGGDRVWVTKTKGIPKPKRIRVRLFICHQYPQ